MTVSKVRIYDLAKELKLDTKRLIEEVRREGVDVSVPSNSVSKELAEKIRTKYFPKKETTVKRAVKVVKKAARPVTEEAPEAAEGSVAVAAEAEPVSEEFVETAPVETPAPEIKHTPAARVIKKLTPAVRAEQPPPITEPVEDIEETVSPPAVVDAEPKAEPVAAATARQPETRPAAPPPPSRQVRVLRPTAAALDAGIRPGERLPPPPPPVAQPARERDERSDRRRERTTQQGRTEYRGTPGETATPQTTYIPPPDSGRRRSRRAAPRGGRKGNEKGGRFDKADFIPPPRALSLEDRIAGRLDSTAGELKPVRLVEGSTVKEFAEKLGIKPKDVVSLLLQRGVFATINQALNDDVAIDLGMRWLRSDLRAVRSDDRRRGVRRINRFRRG